MVYPAVEMLDQYKRFEYVSLNNQNKKKFRLK